MVDWLQKKKKKKATRPSWKDAAAGVMAKGDLASSGARKFAAWAEDHLPWGQGTRNYGLSLVLWRLKAISGALRTPAKIHACASVSVKK